MRKAKQNSTTGDDEESDFVEVPKSHVLALWNLIIRPPRRRYDVAKLGAPQFALWNCTGTRYDTTLTSCRGMRLQCSHFLPVPRGEQKPREAKPCVIYLHANAGCRLEALPLIPRLLPLGISVFAFDFAGCGHSEGEYVSLGWHEREDLVTCVAHLRETGLVSAIGLWGRSMGAVTALLHADRDHSIGGMVLDSPFSNLRGLVTELAQSDYLSLKVPSWLLSGALAMARMRIQSLNGFDIDALAPDRHVGASFVPAFFIAAKGDDFVLPHHTQRLFDAYTGDKELEMVDGDHNSARGSEVNHKAVMFLCRAFRVDSMPMPPATGLAAMDAFGAGHLCGATDADGYHAVGGGRTGTRGLGREAAARICVVADGGRLLGQRERMRMPGRLEGTMQLCEESDEAGFCFVLTPRSTLEEQQDGPTVVRPPLVLFACISAAGLRVERATEHGTTLLGDVPSAVEIGAPLIIIMELYAETPCIRFTIGVDGPEVNVRFGDEERFHGDVLAWTMVKRGDAIFYDCAASSLSSTGNAESEAEFGTRRVTTESDMPGGTMRL